MPVTQSNMADIVGRVIQISVAVPTAVVLYVDAQGTNLVVTAVAEIDNNYTATATFTLAQLQSLTLANFGSTVRTQVNALLDQVSKNAIANLLA